MPSDEKKILLIWPPYVTPRWYPLGISFLAAYLKEKGIGPVDVFDMNSVYLKEIQPLWSFNAILKQGCSIAKRNPLGKNFQDYLNKKREELLIQIRDLGMSSIPWSLKSILASLSEGAAGEAREKVSRLLESVVKRGAYALIGISVNYPEQLFFSLLAAQQLKKTLGLTVKIVMGGAQITKHIDFLKSDPRVYEVVDFLVVRDGEEALRCLCQTEPQKDCRDIPNLYYKDTHDPAAFVASQKSFTLDPGDFLIPDFSYFNPADYEEIVPLIITKGCYWARCSFCTFCLAQDRHFSIGSVENALGLLKGIRDRYGNREFFFVDDALPPNFMEGLAGALLRDKTDIKWSASIILDRAFGDRHFCLRLKESGLDIVSIGLESVSPRVLRLMNKFHQNLSESEMTDTLRALKGAGIKIQLNIMLGFPTETYEEARQTITFLVNNVDLFDYVPIQPFSLEDHTLVAEDPGRFGITHIYKEDKDASLRLGYRYDVKEGMSQSEVLRFMKEEALEAMRIALNNKKKR